MSHKQLEAIGVHGQDDNVLRRKRVMPTRTRRHRYCKKHRSYFCPDVWDKYPDKEKALAAWNEEEEKYRARRKERTQQSS